MSFKPSLLSDLRVKCNLDVYQWATRIEEKTYIDKLVIDVVKQFRFVPILIVTCLIDVVFKH